MGLPVLQHPVFELEQPSTKKTIKYRPFLVKEEKILLMAQQSGNPDEYVKAILQILTNCIFDDDPSSFPIMDIEYMFLQLRASSVSEKAKVNILDDELQDWIEIEVDLSTVKVQGEFNDGFITVNDDIKIEMKYPTYNDLLLVKDDESMMQSTAFVTSCIKRIYNGEEVYDPKDFKQKEVEEFMDSLPSNSWADISKHLVEFPKVSKEVEYDITLEGNKVKKKKKLEGLNDFF